MDKDAKIFETKMKLFSRDGWVCQVCGKPLSAGHPMLGHKIKQNEMYLKKYGKEVVFHDDNMVSCCSLACNAKADLGHKTKLVDDLAKKIQKKLGIGLDTIT